MYALSIFLLSLFSVHQHPTGFNRTQIYQFRQTEDSAVWQEATRFCNLLNTADTAYMKSFLSDEFILQWMHENFIGKKSLLTAMHDTAVLATLQFKFECNEKAVLFYSDNGNAASLNTSFEFLNKTMAGDIKKQQGYGLCIFYFEKENGRWQLKTLHLDIHCSTCNF